MRKKLIFVILLLLTTHLVFPQPRAYVDSLQKQLTDARDDTSRINALVNLCLLYRLGFTDSAIMYGERALALSRQVNFPKGELLAMSFMSITIEQQGNLPKAMEMGFRALQLARETGLEPYATGALNAIGEVYIILNDFPKARAYQQRQMIIDSVHHNQEGFAYGLFDLGVSLEGMNQLDSAAYFEHQAIRMFQSYGREEPLTYITLGDIYLKKGKIDSPLRYYHKGLGIARTSNEARAIAISDNRIATLYKSVNQPDSGIYYARHGLDESVLINQKKTIQEAAALLSNFYEAKDSREALRYLKMADRYKDSLFGAGNLKAIQTMVSQEEAHQKEIQAAQAQYQNKLREYALFAGLGILLLIAFILWRNNRQKQKANKVLEATLEDLKATQAQLIQSEKMASLGELTAGIAHEIQNPLNFVNNFSEVSNELLAEMKEDLARGDFEEAKAVATDIAQNLEKINQHGKRADAIVKGMLLHSRTSGGQKESADINALAEEYLRLSYHGLRAKEKDFNASIQTDFDQSIGMMMIVPQDMGRVLLNLYNNAFYAAEEKKKSGVGGYEPTVNISTKKAGGEVLITVRDNGNGIPAKVIDKIFQPFFTTKPTGQGTGLGLSLSYDIVKAHGGEITVDTKEGEFTSFTVRLPV